jgi:hypothetical protein
MQASNERGVALILALLLTLALSALVASLTVVAQTETWSSQNYRLMTQARYGAEAGVNSVVNYLLNTYAPPSSASATDPIASYNTGVSPVTVVASGDPAILSADDSVTATYPVSSVETAFDRAGQGTMTIAPLNVSYVASATMVSMGEVAIYGTATPATIQTWRIGSTGTVGGSPNAQVHVEATLERQVVPMFQYAAFTTNNGCESLGFSGGGTTDSYDSTAITYDNGRVVTQAYDGNVGSNGNLTSSGSSTTINGSLSTPRTGVGQCNGTLTTAWTANGNTTVTDGLIQLPQPVTYQAPDAPNPPPPTSSDSIHGSVALTPGSYGNLKLTGGATLHLSAGTYDINSISLSGNSTVVIDSGPVILNVAGQGEGTPVDFSGGSITNASLNPSNFQVQYAGTGTLKLTGGSQTSGIVYAPNAGLKFTGGTDWYGAVIGGTLDDSGGTAIHYDRNLQRAALFTLGNYLLNSFTWKKF